MTLAEYVEEYGVKVKHLAKKTGISSTRMYQLVNGEGKPNVENVKAIEEATGGKVRLYDWGS